ncbi:MAG: ferritin-like domain-containing protein, partial [Actinomycetota bacterium]
MPDEKMDVEEVVRLLNRALPMQMRSAALYTWAAGTVVGVEYQGIGMKLGRYGAQELDDARRLLEKVVALGGQPTSSVASFEAFPMTSEGLRKIIAMEDETTEALREIIPATGQEARSEA